MATVDCQTHGVNRLVAVCHHVVEQLQDAKPRGATVSYFADDDSFQALCTECAIVLNAHADGLPPHVKNAMGHQVICEECMNTVMDLNGFKRLS